MKFQSLALPVHLIREVMAVGSVPISKKSCPFQVEVKLLVCWIIGGNCFHAEKSLWARE